MLPETTGGFARVYPFTPDPADHARRFADVLADELRIPWEGRPERRLEQQRFARGTYDWPVVLAEWRRIIAALADTHSTRGLAHVAAASASPDRTVAALTRLRDRGFAPNAIIDAGAYRGDLSRMLRRVFPDAYILMITPCPNSSRTLRRPATRLAMPTTLSRSSASTI